MNWLLIIVLVILAAYTIRGYQKGLLRVLFSLFSLFIIRQSGGKVMNIL